MTWTVRQKEGWGRRSCFALAWTLALLACSCAAAPSPEATGPRASAPVYPTLADSPDRRQAALAAWANLTLAQGIAHAPAPELQPVTQTLKSIPNLSPSLYLPKVGAADAMSEEETREALRRFISAQGTLIGAEPKQLSLVLRTDLADGTKKAKYEQHPFRHPLRGGYGQLEISFAPDRRLLQINSTCIPDVEQLQRALAGLTPALNAEQAATNIVGRTYTYTDAGLGQQTSTVASNEEVKVRELVIYPLPRAGEPSALELHLAWEIMIGKGAGARLLYLDAATNKIIASAPST
ncbi:MAG TPA: hypothetical protein VF553_20310 [Pyrinomonadaceae bacterium]|jgi:hypothetical protein